MARRNRRAMRLPLAGAHANAGGQRAGRGHRPQQVPRPCHVACQRLSGVVRPRQGTRPAFRRRDPKAFPTSGPWGLPGHRHDFLAMPSAVDECLRWGFPGPAAGNGFGDPFPGPGRERARVHGFTEGSGKRNAAFAQAAAPVALRREIAFGSGQGAVVIDRPVHGGQELRFPGTSRGSGSPSGIGGQPAANECAAARGAAIRIAPVGRQIPGC